MITPMKMILYTLHELLMVDSMDIMTDYKN